MARVSSQTLSKSVEDDLLLQLLKVLTRAKKTKGGDFLKALFTPEERMMHAKRIAVIGMLRDGLSTYRIIQVLKMSSSTVIRMKHDYEADKYEAIVRTLGTSKKEREEFWKTVEIILRAGLPPRGKGRWSWLKAMHAP